MQPHNDCLAKVALVLRGGKEVFVQTAERRVSGRAVMGREFSPPPLAMCGRHMSMPGKDMGNQTRQT